MSQSMEEKLQSTVNQKKRQLYEIREALSERAHWYKGLFRFNQSSFSLNEFANLLDSVHLLGLNKLLRGLAIFAQILGDSLSGPNNIFKLEKLETISSAFKAFVSKDLPWDLKLSVVEFGFCLYDVSFPEMRISKDELVNFFVFKAASGPFPEKMNFQQIVLTLIMVLEMVYNIFMDKGAADAKSLEIFGKISTVIEDYVLKPVFNILTLVADNLITEKSLNCLGEIDKYSACLDTFEALAENIV